MAGPDERVRRGAGGSGEAQAQGQPRDSAMAPVQPSLGPPRDEPRVFGLDKFNGNNFAECSFRMENVFDNYDLLEVMEGTEKRPENDPEKSPWMRKSAQGYLLLGKAFGSSQIRHIKPFQHEPEKGPKAWPALKGVHAPATAAVAVVLEREKVDYKELFAPVVKPTTLRTLLAGAAIKGWVVKQMDVTTAFLNGVLEEEIFMAQPEEFDDGSGRVLRLKKALYGLKQAPWQWYLKLREVLEEIGFTPSSADHFLFMFGEGEQRSFMVVYVDEILIFSPSSDLVKEVMMKLQDKLKCKALGDVSFYLELHIERDVEKRCMRVHQRKCWCNPTVCIRLVVRVHACVCAWNGMRA
ncbi:unnamed protein product [Closterium sp. NIES-53]